MKNLKLFVLTLVTTLSAQNAVAEYIACTFEGSSYLYFDTTSLELNIPEALGIPGNDNAVKGLFNMTERSTDTFSATFDGEAFNYGGCSVYVYLSFFNSTDGQLRMMSNCRDGHQPIKSEIYKTNLSCTRY